MNAELEARLSLMIDAGQRGDKAMVRALAEPDEEDGPPEDRDGAPVNKDALARVLTGRDAFIAAKRRARGKAVGLAEVRDDMFGASLLEGFTGTLVTKNGAHRTYVDGKQVANTDAGGSGKPSGPSRPKAPLSEKAHDIATRFEVNGRRLAKKIEAGEISPGDAFDYATAMEGKALKATRQNFAFRVAAFRHRVVSDLGADALKTPEWQAIEGLYADAKKRIASNITDMADAMREATVQAAKKGGMKKYASGEPHLYETLEFHAEEVKKIVNKLSQEVNDKYTAVVAAAKKSKE